MTKEEIIIAAVNLQKECAKKAMESKQYENAARMLSGVIGAVKSV